MAARTFQSEVRSGRTSGLEIYGVAKGLDGQNVADSYGQIVQWARDGKRSGAAVFDHDLHHSAIMR